MAVLLHSLARSFAPAPSLSLARAFALARPLLRARSFTPARQLLRARSPAPSLFLARSFALARLLLAFARPTSPTNTDSPIALASLAARRPATSGFSSVSSTL